MRIFAFSKYLYYAGLLLLRVYIDHSHMVLAQILMKTCLPRSRIHEFVEVWA
jgi:hypothetical protein